jgi:hypothetical protein
LDVVEDANLRTPRTALYHGNAKRSDLGLPARYIRAGALDRRSGLRALFLPTSARFYKGFTRGGAASC